MRLTPAIEDSSLLTREGRLEICINNAWGSVCDDSFFDSADAQVACGQLGGFIRQGLPDIKIKSLLFYIYYTLGAVKIVSSNQDNLPVYLSELLCTGNEGGLLDCARRFQQPTGLYSCDSDQAVAVRCAGIILWSI